MSLKGRLTGLFTAFTAVTLAVACSPSDTSADVLAGSLEESLSRHTLDDVPLLHEDSKSSFHGFIDPLEEFPVEVEVGEIEYDLLEATLPLHWTWDIHGNTWEYDTLVDAVYEDSEWLATWVPSSFIPDLEPGTKVGVDRVSPPRANIVSADGSSIMKPRKVTRYGLDKTKVDDGDIKEAAQAIAEATGVDSAPFVDRALSMGPKAFVEAISVRPADKDEWIDEDFHTLPGALAVTDELFLGPTSTFARELLGRVGEATAEIIEESDGTITNGEVVGLSGLQKQYDTDLRGADEIEIYMVPATECVEPSDCDESERTQIVSLSSSPPEDLAITINTDFQIAAEETLNAIDLPKDSPSGSALVAIDSSGQIVALANSLGNTGLDHASTGRYPPGSTFKVVTALALLRSGVSPSDTVSCPATIDVDGREFQNYDDYPAEYLGDISFTDAFAQSCNTALIALRDQITPANLNEAALSLGFATGLDNSDLGFPSFLGDDSVPHEETAFAASLIGQGEILASPLSMAVVAASVNNAETITPKLFPESTAASDPTLPLTEDEAATLRDLMAETVSTGTATLLKDLDPQVTAKTGTAEHGNEDADPHAWIIGSQNDLSVAVFVEAGVGGAETAGPVLKEFLTSVSDQNKVGS